MSDSDTTTTIWGLRILLFASLGLFLLVTLTEISRSPPAAPGLPPPTDSFTRDTLIVPGTRVGPVTLGLSVRQVSEVLGAGQLRPRPNGLVHLYEELGLVLYSESDRIVSVTVRLPQFKMRTGVGVGSDVDEILSTFRHRYELDGDSESSYILRNWEEGLHVGVADDKITHIQITAKLITGPPRGEPDGGPASGI